MRKLFPLTLVSMILFGFLLSNMSFSEHVIVQANKKNKNKNTKSNSNNKNNNGGGSNNSSGDNNSSGGDSNNSFSNVTIGPTRYIIIDSVGPGTPTPVPICYRSNPPICLATATPTARPGQPGYSVRSPNRSGNAGNNVGSVMVLTFADLNANGAWEVNEPRIGKIGLSLQNATTNKTATTSANGEAQFGGLTNNNQYNLSAYGYGNGLSLTGSNPRVVRASNMSTDIAKYENQYGSQNRLGYSNRVSAPKLSQLESFIDWLYGFFGRFVE